jgi:hypothetical protein
MGLSRKDWKHFMVFFATYWVCIDVDDVDRSEFPPKIVVLQDRRC